MLLEELKNEILEARQTRHKKLLEYLKNTEGSVVEISVNVPGVDKRPAGAFELFEEGCRHLNDALILSDCFAAEDAAGYYCICHCLEEAKSAKLAAIKVEEESEAARLLDIDIYDKQGKQLGRREVGLAPRKCLVCGEPAVDCIRSNNHDIDTVTSEIQRLLHRLWK